MERFAYILQPHIRASKIRLSYIDELFVDLKNNPYIILHKNDPDETKLSDYNNGKRDFDEHLTKHDSPLSGTPLEYSFGNYEFEDTVVIGQTWRKQEKLYLPLSRNDACNALNICLEHLDNNTLPILALCDGKDPKQSRLIGVIVYKDRFITLEAVSTGMTTLATIRNERQKIVQEHLKRAFVQEHNVCNIQ
ncbi:hypothetical protein EAG_03507 [Camponotus floridanus]|uniref:Uncharacterized protein n=1 Tax=Camponotus floridanus TaxID=104421 RepID=E2ACE0_CAMFO|nr:hypothetical protein EAG_03507 [Camponotus floridanus]